MPVDIDYTTKLSEEQRKFFSISTGSPSTKTTENLNATTFDLPYLHSTRPTAQTSPQQRAASKHFPTDEPRFSTKSSSKTAKRIFFHRLVPSSSSCSTGMFIVTAPLFLCTHSTWSWSSAGLAHYTQWLGRGARNVLPIPADSKFILIAKGSISMLTAGRFSTKWRDFESTFCQ